MKLCIRFARVFLLASLAMGSRCQAQNGLVHNHYTDSTGLPHLSIERSMVFVPDSNWWYSHHASISHIKNKLIAIWSNGIKDEDQPGQRIVYAVSTNFKHWSKPSVLATPSPYNKDTANVLTAAGLYYYHDTLVAYYGEYSPYRTHTQLWAKTTTDGIHWSTPINLHVPLIPNHGPQAIAGGRLIISGNFIYPYTDDPKGLSGWKISSIYPDSVREEDNSHTFYNPAKKTGRPPLCEGSFLQTADGTIHLLLRATGNGWKGRLWESQSTDSGAHWSLPIETAFSDNDSKFHFGRLPDGRYYYVGIPDTLHHYDRNPLVFSVSNDGLYFDKQYIIASDLYPLKKQGLWKGGQYGYPHTMVYKGYLYVIITRQKEAVEIIRFNISGL